MTCAHKGSVQLRIEVEVVSPSSPAVRDQLSSATEYAELAAGAEEQAEIHLVEGVPLLGTDPKVLEMGIEAQGGDPASFRAWRRCTVWQCCISLAVCSAAMLLVTMPLAEAFWYWLVIISVFGSAWLCIRRRLFRRPVVAHALRRQPRTESGGKIRILSLNICLLPAGINFSGKCLCDGDDRKAERLGKLEALLDDFDIVLLNELWGSSWSGHHDRFTATALCKGFDVVFDPIGFVTNTGNMILSRFPLRDPQSIIFTHHAGWQSLVPNGVLHATCQLPTGEPLHLFTTHLQCTTAPPAELRPPESPSAADSINAGVLDLLEKGEKVSGGKCDSVRKGQLHEIKALMDSVIPTREDSFLLAGDLNIEGGSPEYAEMTRIFGHQSLCAPDFRATYNTDSFLTPPGWRGIEYSVCLDHIITNLEQVETFAVLDDDLSDHRGLALVVTPPEPALECSGGASASETNAAGPGPADKPEAPWVAPWCPRTSDAEDGQLRCDENMLERVEIRRQGPAVPVHQGGQRGDMEALGVPAPPAGAAATVATQPQPFPPPQLGAHDKPGPPFTQRVEVVDPQSVSVRHLGATRPTLDI